MSLKRGYKQVAIPSDLANEIENYITKHSEEGYMSIPEFIREAIRMDLKSKSSEVH